MSERNDGGLAFPSKRMEPHQIDDVHVEHVEVTYPGLTMRDYFAAKALPLAWALEQQAPTGRYSEHMEPSYSGAAARAYFFADAMLQERAK